MAVASTTRSRIGLPLGPGLALLVALLPLPGIAPGAQSTAAVAVWMATWWMTEAIPIAATSLLPLALFPIAGIMSSQDTATPYANHLIFLFMGGFFIAKTMQRWGLHRRLALMVVVAVGTGPRRLVLGVMLATALLSMWISNTATTVMMLPIGTALIEELRRQRLGSGSAPAAAGHPRRGQAGSVGLGDTAGDAREPDSEGRGEPPLGSAEPAGLDGPGEPRLGGTEPEDHDGLGQPLGGGAEPGDDEVTPLATALMLGIAYAASIGGVATLIGTPPNLVLASMASQLLDREIGFLHWMAIGLPVTGLLLPLTWLYLTRIAHPVPVDLEVRSEVLRGQLTALGRMSPGERAALWIFVGTALAWVAREEKAIGSLVVPGIVTWLPQVSDATVAMVGALVAFALPLSLRQGRFALDWETARSIPWGVLILFGGGLSLAEAFQQTGLSGWIAGVVTLLGDLPVWLIVTLTATLIIFLTELTSNTATTTMALPVFAAAAVGLQLDPYLLMVPAAIAASMAFMLPVATPPNAIVFGSGMVTVPQMARAGLVLNLISIVLASTATLLLVPWALGG